MLLLLALGCSPDSPTPPAPQVPFALWPGADLRPALDHPLFRELEGLGDLSLYSGFVEGDPAGRPDAAHRGAFAVGNGLTFALMGLTDPLNTIHSLVGPRYEKDSSFFGDVSTVLELDGEVLTFEREWIARVRGTAVLVTRADAPGISLYTVDFGPRLGAGGDPPALVRLLAAIRTGEGDSGSLAVRIRSHRTPEERDGVPVEVLDDGDRLMGYLGWGAPLQTDDAGLSIPLGDLGPGESAEAALVLATGTSMEELLETKARLPQATPREWLQATLEDWSAFTARGVQLDLPDPRIEDLFDGMRTGIRVQQSDAGGVSPMSRYTGVWLRDTIGPVRFYSRAGLHDEARAALDYLFLCASVEGDYSNQCKSGLTTEDLVEEPDWDSLGGWTGRLAAEGPTYVPLMYRHYTAATGDWSPVEERWSYLRRSLLAQEMDDEGRQPFSGDETYRVAMAAALGYELTIAFEDQCWSANSSMLMAAAADWMALAAERQGIAEDAATFAELAERARGALADHFLQDGGGYAPFVFYDGTVEPRPYEDVSLKPLWTGALTPDDPGALANLEVLLDAAGRGDGTVQTPLDPAYENALGMQIEDGICTGMLPGYVLDNLTAVGHPEAQAAFNALHRYADPAGHYTEYMVYDDLSSLQIVYDPAGGLGDYTARYRPWEGGIDIDAMLVYLLGSLEPGDGADLVLRPHLPNGLPWLEAGPLRAGEAAVDLRLDRAPGSLTATVRSVADVDFLLQLDLPFPPGAASADGVATVDGEPAGVLTTLPAGEEMIRFEPRSLSPGSELSFVALLH